MKNALVLFGSSVNPPHLGHKYILEKLSGVFGQVVFLPAGVRSDKLLIEGKHRRQMVEIMLDENWLCHYSNVKIDFCDIDGKNTPTFSYLQGLKEKKYPSEIYFSIGSDLLVPRVEYNGKSEIEAVWYEGDRLLREFKIFLFPRKGYPLSLVQHKYYLAEEFIAFPDFSSSLIRKMLKEGKLPLQFLDTRVLSYIKAHNLYI